MKRLFTALSVALLAGMAACAKFNVPASYSMNPASGTGLAVFSFTANDAEGNFYLQYRGVHGGPRGDVTLHTLRNPLDWRDPRGRLVVIELPAGAYELYNMTSLASFVGTQAFSVPFVVEPGRAAYLGNVHADIGASTFDLRVTDRPDRDLGLFFERYPRLSRDDVDVTISRVEWDR